MSSIAYAGADYAYDVYVGYGRGPETVGNVTDTRLRDWTAKLVATLIEKLCPPGYEQDPTLLRPIFYHETEADALLPAMSANARAALETSALMLIFLSPSYCEGGSCREELRLFLESARARGGASERIVAAMPLPTAPSADDPDLGALISQIGTGEALAEFYDPAKGEPIELERAAPGSAPFDTIYPGIVSLANEIKSKLDKLRRMPGCALIAPQAGAEPAARLGLLGNTGQIEARSDTAMPPAGEITPQVYLQGHSDLTSWKKTRDVLSKIAIVYPEEIAASPAGSGFKERMAARDKRIEELADCNGIVLLRAGAADDIGPAAKAAQWELNFMRQKSDPGFAWFLMDWVDNPEPRLPQNMKLPRIRVTQPDWPDKVRGVLGIS